MAERHLRVDAQRNRVRILEAATELMATHGIDVPIDEIAQRAQVGVGTVYRNFPTKGALFEALLMARIEPLVTAAPSSAVSATSSPISRRLPMRWLHLASTSASPSTRSPAI
jgi:AcrR family transcriptional regulator